MMAWYSVVLACFMRGVLSPRPPKKKHARTRGVQRPLEQRTSRKEAAARTPHRSFGI
jgi:hypothetical protein